MLKIKNFDCYDGLCFCGGLVFYAPVALLVRTQAGLTVSQFFLLQGLLSAATFLGEIPAGLLTDRIGYKRTLVLAQVVILLARATMLAGFLLKRPWLFVVEALLEGLCFCFTSGTAEAYLYEVCGEERYISKTASSSNYGTAGFLVSTLAYAGVYRRFGISGLLAASAVSACGGLLFSLGLTPERRHCGSRTGAPRVRDMVHLLRQGAGFVVLASVFSLAGLVINFFYAEKLLSCGLDAAWMSPIILGYSLVGMLAKVILDALRTVPKSRVIGIFCSLAAGAMMALGFSGRPLPAVSLMILLPLLLSVPGCCLSGLENAFIDRFDGGQNRAAALSMLSMGTDLVEILALFASAALTAAGPALCFPAVGLMLLLGGIWFSLSF